jgi:putative acetyltransferase
VTEAPYVVRRARHGDERDMWRVHTRAIIEVSAKDYPAAVIDELLSPEPMENVESSPVCFFVAEADGAVVGLAGVDLVGGSIPVVMVDPKHLRQGIGTRLLARVQEHARNAGVGTLTVGSSKYAREFYRALGFSGGELRTVKGRRTGVDFAEYHMEKVL